MILIADSGSTKTDFVALDNNGKKLFSIETSGLNPEVLDKTEIISRISKKNAIQESKNRIEKLFFYSAGCGTSRMKNQLYSAFSQYFPNAKISVLEDTYAAVYSTNPTKEKAIIGILGTGSNCSYFDGKKLHQKVESLGYLAMDDASGNRFGRKLIRKYYFNRMPKHLAQLFSTQYDLDPDVIKENFYKKTRPNAYLASFTKFLIQHKSDPFCQKIIANEFESFVKNYIKQFDDYKKVSVHFTGSIAYFLKEELQETLDKHNIKLGNVLQKPMDGLIEYHKINIE